MTGPASGDAALVLLSGGQDSATCLAWALERFDRVETVAFDYGQRHRVELDCRAEILRRLPALSPDWARRIGEDHHVDLGFLGAISDTALTREAAIAFDAQGLPNTFVPGRNLLFFTAAAAIGYRRNILHLVGGMCETDYSGYPDCRDAAIRALEASIAAGMDREFRLETPLMRLDKGETWALAHSLGGDKLVELIRDHTLSCYLGERERRHDWGPGCGECPACELRAAGWRRYSDPPT